MKSGDPFMASFGRAVVRWSALEFELGRVFGNLAGTDKERGLTVFYLSNDFSSRCQLIKSLLPFIENDEWLATEVRAIVGYAEELINLWRNLLHGEWIPLKPNKHRIIIYRPRGQETTRTLTVTLKDLDDLGRALDKIIEKARKVSAYLGDKNQ